MSADETSPRDDEVIDDDTQVVYALDPVRHACHGCGTCCMGWRVHLQSPAEHERVRAQAEALGIADPIVGDVLRRHEGRCVFLTEDMRCAIHARFGSAEKPLTCRHFPRRSCHAEDGIRIAVDPGCSSTWRTWADGPQLEPWVVHIDVTYPRPRELFESELALLALARQPGMTIPQLAAVLTGDRAHLPAPPPPFVARLLSRVARATPYLLDLEHGHALLAALAPIAAVLEPYLAHQRDGYWRWDAALVPPWKPLPAASDAFALDVLARFLFIRIGDASIPPMAHALIVLGGVLACAYADPSPEVFGPRLSAWTRACRHDKFWVPILPDLATAERVLRDDPQPVGADI